MLRVVENDGTMLLFPTKCNSANNIHRSLTGKGFERIRFEQPGAGFVR
ncbi:methyltransferase type 11 [Mesotoga sp. H07pep.5.4]|nr:methyltransferase type 11 [Mesotoga sp. H07pep.5.4]